MMPHDRCQPECVRCPGRFCKIELMARVVAIELSLPQQIADVGRQVAHVCAGMDQPAAAACFERMFRIDPQCAMFRRFFAAYQSERRRIRRGIASSGPGLHLCAANIANLLAAIPPEVANA